MSRKTLIAVLLLLAACVQTVNAQSLIVNLKNNKTVPYSISEVDSIYFSEKTLHDWVDLGLPSGTLWATCNVGAISPEESGYYFAWGETETKERYYWDTYKYCEGTDYALTKYCIDSLYGYDGYTDGLTELLPEDDAATAKWGSEWQMPSQGQMEELYDNNYTTVKTVTQDEVDGYKITSLINGNSIFLPVTGEMNGETLVQATTALCYWTRSLSEKVNSSGMVYVAFFNDSANNLYSLGRCYGHPVRPVCVQETPYQWPVKRIIIYEENVTVQIGETKQISATAYPTYAYNKTLAWESGDEAVATVDSEGRVTGVAAGSCTITISATDGSGVSASFVVIVKQDVTRISLNPTSLTLSIGNSQNLTATVYPDNATNKTLSWESSNTNIATVDQTGNVTAKANGNCTITCRAKDGSGVYAECQVSVRELQGFTNGYEWVDLDLPSGTLWATCNIGANNPEEVGNYYAWGETQPKQDYSWNTYQYCEGSAETLTKYCINSECGYNGFIDNLRELSPVDDVARVNWGGDWQIPSIDQCFELTNKGYTTEEWTTQNGVNGLKVTSKSNGKSIFLPYTGYYEGTTLKEKSSHGLCWSRSLESSITYIAYGMHFRTTNGSFGSYTRLLRCYGQTVRPVRKR